MTGAVSESAAEVSGARHSRPERATDSKNPSMVRFPVSETFKRPPERPPEPSPVTLEPPPPNALFQSASGYAQPVPPSESLNVTKADIGQQLSVGTVPSVLSGGIVLHGCAPPDPALFPPAPAPTPGSAPNSSPYPVVVNLDSLARTRLRASMLIVFAETETPRAARMSKPTALRNSWHVKGDDSQLSDEYSRKVTVLLNTMSQMSAGGGSDGNGHDARDAFARRADAVTFSTVAFALPLPESPRQSSILADDITHPSTAKKSHTSTAV